MTELKDVLISLFDGTYPIFALLAFSVIILRIFTREWTSAETIVLGALLLHSLLEILQTYSEHGNLYVSKRYLLPCAPVLFGWTAYGIFATYQWIIGRFHSKTVRWTLWILIVFHALILIFDGIYPVVKTYNSKLKNSRSYTIGKKAAPLIMKDYHGPAFYRFSPNSLRYETGRRPLIATKFPSAAYFCGGTAVSLEYPFYDYIILPGDAVIPAGHILKFSIQEGATDIKIYIPETPPDLPNFQKAK